MLVGNKEIKFILHLSESYHFICDVFKGQVLQLKNKKKHKESHDTW